MKKCTLFANIALVAGLLFGSQASFAGEISTLVSVNCRSSFEKTVRYVVSVKDRTQNNAGYTSKMTLNISIDANKPPMVMTVRDLQMPESMINTVSGTAVGANGKSHSVTIKINSVENAQDGTAFVTGDIGVDGKSVDFLNLECQLLGAG